MKTPDEIKKGLECCGDYKTESCDGCPYEVKECEAKQALCLTYLALDALAYIQQLEAELDDEKNKNEILIFDNDKLMGEIDQVERERDAAIHDLTESSFCADCKHYSESVFNEPCSSCVEDVETKKNFQWRGPCPENTKEEK